MTNPITAAIRAAAKNNSTLLEAENREMRAALERMTKRSYLVDIRRNGRLIMFDFMHEGAIFTIETYGTMSDDVQGWKQKLCT